jgi:hypothetical protein
MSGPDVQYVCQCPCGCRKFFNAWLAGMFWKWKETQLCPECYSGRCEAVRKLTGGYQPTSSNLDPQNPPQGGSGVPPAESNQVKA